MLLGFFFSFTTRYSETSDQAHAKKINKKKGTVRFRDVQGDQLTQPIKEAPLCGAIPYYNHGLFRSDSHSHTHAHAHKMCVEKEIIIIRMTSTI